MEWVPFINFSPNRMIPLLSTPLLLIPQPNGPLDIIISIRFSFMWFDWFAMMVVVWEIYELIFIVGLMDESRWYSEKFTRGQWEKEDCVSEWEKYRACLVVWSHHSWWNSRSHAFYGSWVSFFFVMHCNQFPSGSCLILGFYVMLPWFYVVLHCWLHFPGSFLPFKWKGCAGSDYRLVLEKKKISTLLTALLPVSCYLNQNLTNFRLLEHLNSVKKKEPNFFVISDDSRSASDYRILPLNRMMNAYGNLIIVYFAATFGW